MLETWLSESYYGHEDEVNFAKPTQNVVKLFHEKTGYQVHSGINLQRSGTTVNCPEE